MMLQVRIMFLFAGKLVIGKDPSGASSTLLHDIDASYPQFV